MCTSHNIEKPMRLRRRTWWTFPLFFMVTALMQFLTGCSFPAFPPEYPPQLPPLVPGDANSGVCPNVAGHYLDKGKALTPKGENAGEVSLSQLLHNNDPCFAQADSVFVVGLEKIRLRGPGEQKVLEIKSLKNGQPFAKWRSAMDYFVDCEKGFVQIYCIESTGSFSGHYDIWGSSDSLWLRHAVDGSLIVLRKEVDWGFILLFPYRLENDLWYRFPPVMEGVLPE